MIKHTVYIYNVTIISENFVCRRLSPTLTDSMSPLNGSMNGSMTGSGGSGCSSPSPPGLNAVRRMIPDAFATNSLFGAMSSFSISDEHESSSIVCGTGLTSVVDVTQVVNGGITCPVQVPTLNGQIRRQCFMCSESDIVAALVPCGHNLFCMECANLIVEKPTLDRSCPVCNQTPTQAIRIIS